MKAAALATALLACLTTDAFAAGSISGSVTNAAGGAPIQNVQVRIHNAAGTLVASPVTDAAGAYLASGLPAGTYYLRTFDSVHFINELYNNLPCALGDCTPTTGTPVVVTDGVTTAGINFALVAGGRIGGTVTNAAGGAPIQNVQVRIHDAAGTLLGSVTTNAAGAYLTSGLPAHAGSGPAGTYRVRTDDSPGFVDELYNNLPCPADGCTVTTGTLVVVTVGATTAGIDFALAAGGQIGGTVTNAADGAPIPNVQVRINNAAGTFVGSATTNASGTYLTAGLPAGTYYARTGSTLSFVDELYDNLPCTLSSCTTTTGTPIVVTVGATTGGIDFALVAAGQIGGTVTWAAGGVPIPNVNVRIHNSAGTQVGSVNTNASGTYLTSGLPAGTYYARTSSLVFVNVVDELYNNLPCTLSNCTTTTGTPIVVTVGATTAGIDFALAVGGQISGTVTNAASGAPIPNVTVRVYDSTGAFVGTAINPTNAAGTSVTSGLPAGTYHVRTDDAPGFVDELYNNLPCAQSNCVSSVTTGTPVVVTVGATSYIGFALAAGGQIGGMVTNAAGGAPIQNVQAQIYNAAGTFVGSVTTNAAGTYLSSGLPAGTYYAVTRNTVGFIDELYDDVQCSVVDCYEVTAGTPIVVAAGATTAGVNFALATGGQISGTVTNAVGGAPIQGVTVVHIYDAGGSRMDSVYTNASGTYLTTGLPAGTYYVRTENVVGFVDELYNNLPCPSGLCTVTTGTPVVVAVGATTSGVNFALTPSLTQNGNFSNGTTGWLTFGAPDSSYMESNVTNGAFQFRRVPQPAGQPVSQAVIFQNTGMALPTGTAMTATFDLGNTSSERKYMKVLLVGDPNFGDMAACTFWLEPNASLRTYQMKASTTQAWTDAAIYFYASSAQTDGGYYQVDNVSFAATPGGSLTQTDCVDQMAPNATGGAAGPNLVTNGTFASGLLAPWTTFGTITLRSPIVGAVLEMIRPTNVDPPGVVLNATGQAMTLGQILTATFQLGNSSGVRQRALVIVHDNDFSDLVACNMWLAPGQGLTAYTMTLYASKAWTNATVAVYPRTVGNVPWVRLDNVTLTRTPATAIVGTTCAEGGAAAVAPASIESSASSGGTVSLVASALVADLGGRAGGGRGSAGAGGAVWEAVAIGTGSSVWDLEGPVDLTAATEARLTFASWLSTRGSTAAVEVSLDGGATWVAVAEVAASETWVPVEVDLGAYVEQVLDVRFVFDAVAPADPAAPDSWRVEDVELDITAP